MFGTELHLFNISNFDKKRVCIVSRKDISYTIERKKKKCVVVIKKIESFAKIAKFLA